MLTKTSTNNNTPKYTDDDELHYDWGGARIEKQQHRAVKRRHAAAMMIDKPDTTAKRGALCARLSGPHRHWFSAELAPYIKHFRLNASFSSLATAVAATRARCAYHVVSNFGLKKMPFFWWWLFLFSWQRLLSLVHHHHGRRAAACIY